jgi:hypothetical protein
MRKVRRRDFPGVSWQWAVSIEGRRVATLTGWVACTKFAVSHHLR